MDGRGLVYGVCEEIIVRHVDCLVESIEWNYFILPAFGTHLTVYNLSFSVSKYDLFFAL